MKKLFELVGILRVDGLVAAEKQMSVFEKQLKKSLAPIERFGKQVVGIGTNLTKAFTVPLTLAGGAVLKFGGDFEDAMTNSLSIMGNVSAEMRSEMEKVTLQLSEELPYSATQAAESYFFLASAGKTAAQSMSLMPTVAKFATAGNFDLALATDLLTDAQSALGLTSKDVVKDQQNMVRLSDVLVKANVLANASVEQFSTSLTNKAGTALRMLNKDVEEGVAVLAAFADQGVKDEKAGEQLSIVLRDLQTSALNNGQAFKDANIQIWDSTGKMNNMGDIIAMLERRFVGMSDKQKRAELTMLGFQDRSVAALLTLIGTSEGIKRYEAELRKAGGTTDEVSGKQMESFSKQLTTIKNRLMNVAIEFSKSLIPVVKQQVIPMLEKFIEKGRAIATWFNELPTGVRSTVFEIAAFLAILGPTLIVVGKLITSVKLITTAFAAAKLVMVAFNATLLATPTGVVIAGIVAMGVAVKTLIGKLETEKTLHGYMSSAMTEEQEKRAALVDGLEALKNKVKEATETIKDEKVLTDMFGESITELTEKAKALGYTIEGSASEKFEALMIIQDQLNGVIDSSTGKVVQYTEKVKEQADGVDDLTEKTLEQIEAEKKLREEKEGFINDYQGRIEKLVLTEKEQLELEEKRALERATKLGLSEAEIAEIQAYYEIEKFNLQVEMDLKAVESAKETADTKDQLAQELYNKNKERADKELEEEKKRKEALKQSIYATLTFASDVYSLFTNNKMAKLDEEMAKEREAIENSKLSEEEKQKKFEALDAKAAKKRKELNRQQAKGDKAQSIVSASISTWEAATKALTAGPFIGPIMAGIITALGLAKVGLIAAAPLPQLAEGALIKQSHGGTPVIVGEGDDDEAVLPMRKGAWEIADRILNRLSDFTFPSTQQQPGFATGSGSGSLGGNSVLSRPVETHLHVGTLIADKGGLKNLERKLYELRQSEQTRRGE